MTQPIQPPTPPRPAGVPYPGPTQPMPNGAAPYGPPPMAPTPPPAAPKKGHWFTSKPAIGIGALVLGLIIGIAGSGGSAGTATAGATVTVTGAAGATVTQQVTTTATVATTVTAQPAPPAGTFQDGTWLVNKDIKPGTYKTANTSGQCYWARLKDTEGTIDSILANDNLSGPGVVTIKATDFAFESSRCGEWQPA